MGQTLRFVNGYQARNYCLVAVINVTLSDLNDIIHTYIYGGHETVQMTKAKKRVQSFHHSGPTTRAKDILTLKK